MLEGPLGDAQECLARTLSQLASLPATAPLPTAAREGWEPGLCSKEPPIVPASPNEDKFLTGSTWSWPSDSSPTNLKCRWWSDIAQHQSSQERHSRTFCRRPTNHDHSQPAPLSSFHHQVGSQLVPAADSTPCNGVSFPQGQQGNGRDSGGAQRLANKPQGQGSNRAESSQSYQSLCRHIQCYLLDIEKKIFFSLMLRELMTTLI